MLESSGVECVFIRFWIWKACLGAPQCKWKSTCIADTPIFLATGIVTLDRAHVLESSGVEWAFLCFWIWWPGAPKCKFLLTCIVNTPFFFWQLEFSNDCACARIFWCGMRRRLFLDLDGLVLKMQLGINSCCQCSLCFWQLELSHGTTVSVFESCGVKCVFVCFWAS